MPHTYSRILLLKIIGFAPPRLAVGQSDKKILLWVCGMFQKLVPKNKNYASVNLLAGSTNNLAITVGKAGGWGYKAPPPPSFER